MQIPSIESCIREIEEEYYVTAANDERLLRKIFELRYQVYCTERGFLPGRGGLECDEFDHRSRHLALISRTTGELVGTARLVMPCAVEPMQSFPMQQVCDPATFEQLPLSSCVEISRFAISKQRRTPSTALMRLALIQGLVTASGKLGVTHWCAVMEPTLLRLLRMTSIYFHPLGPPIEYHGIRQPCFNRLDLLLDAVYTEREALWDYLTLGSEFWRERADRRVAA